MTSPFTVSTRLGGAWAPGRVTVLRQALTGIDVRTLGVAGDGSDESTAMQAALDSLSAGQVLQIPAGLIVRHDTVLRAQKAGATIVGPGELRASSQAMCSLIVTANGVTLDGLTLRLPNVPAERLPSPRNTHRLTLEGADGVTLRDVSVRGSAATGIRIGGCTNYLLERCHVYGSAADGIHNTDASNNGVIRDCTVEANGDDQISVVSYANDVGTCHHIQVLGCSGTGNFHGRGMTVVGGEDVLFENFTIDSPNAAGIYISCEESFQTRDTRRVTYRSGVVRNASIGVAMGAIHIPNTRAAQEIADIRLESIDISGTGASSNRQVRYTSTGGGPMQRIYAKNLSIVGGPSPVFTTDLPASAYRNTGWKRDGTAVAAVGSFSPTNP